jgi:hypothetical protein
MCFEENYFMRLPSIFPYGIGCIAGFVVFSGNWILSREQVWLLGLGCYLFILLIEFVLSRIHRKKVEAK